MEQDTAQNPEPGGAAQAFVELRAEVSLLRRAVERLTDERTSQPDYAPTLEAIGKGLADVGQWARRVSEKPAMKLTPESLARDIATAAENARGRDEQTLQRAAREMTAAGSRADAMIVRSRSIAEQKREVNRNRIAFAVAGIVLWAILPGAVARSLPVSWAVPEQIAARMLGLNMWNAGQDLMAKSNPERWNEIVRRERERAASPQKDDGR